MNLSSFEYFIEVEKHRSFSKAAETLHISQQALSSHISSLEKELGCTLFVRHIPLELTYAGEHFLSYASSFSNMYTDMLKEFQDISAEHVGRLKIGITHTRGKAILPDIITEFQNKHPRYEVEIVESTSEFLVKKLLDHEIDIAIGYIDKQDGIRTELFYDEELLLMMPNRMFQNLLLEKAGSQEISSYRFAPSLLENCPMLMGSRDDMSGILTRRYLKKNKLEPPIKAMAENIETLIMLCVKGVGACMAPESLIKATLSSQQLDQMAIIAPDLHTPVSFAVREEGYQWFAIDEFKKIAMENIAEITNLGSPIKRYNDSVPVTGRTELI
ncbi:MAG: LysR family transcriptional regulator [Firmicutes bacterium]|nr:LysR family transcriptional regulator [Bacillota bacterium]